MTLSEDKISHLSHLVLNGLKDGKLVTFLEDEVKVLREIKRAISEEAHTEQEIDETVRAKLASYSRPIYDGSPEWQVLYQKFYREELNKRERK